MRELIIASGNAHKIQELTAILGDTIRLVSLTELGIGGELREDAATLEGNARQKARYIRDTTGRDCFADDTGLEITALGGAPGVASAMYSGPERDQAANRARVLREMEGITDRSAQFRTVFSLILAGAEYQFEGIVKGTILTRERGEGGFGYDAIFCPEGSDRSFGEMTAEEKNVLSHRARAAEAMAAFLRTL
jgi:XTP/dITP diphosphohydrolase